MQGHGTMVPPVEAQVTISVTLGAPDARQVKVAARYTASQANTKVITAFNNALVDAFNEAGVRD